MEKKTISELYQECKQKQEMEQQLEYLRETTELFKKRIAKDFFCGPIPQSFQGKV